MNKSLIKFLISLPLIILLTSCASDKKIVDLNLKYVTDQTPPTASVDTDAQAQVAEAATAVGQSLQQLSAMQMATHPGTKLKQPFDDSAIGMGQLATVNWSGPAEPLLEKIAAATKYQLRVFGPAPAIPVLVSVNMQNQPIAAILRNVTYQIVSKASVGVYPKYRTIELRYHGN